MTMDLTKLFQVQDGSVVGRTHVGRGSVLTGRNSQDAFYWCAKPGRIVAVVCDGCGSTPYSEVGARLIATTVVRQARYSWDRLRKAELQMMYDGLLQTLDMLARRCAPDSTQEAHRTFVHEHLLATVVMAIVRPRSTTIASIGDGCFAVNGEFQSLDNFDGRPPYPAYGLLERNDQMAEESFQFTINAELPTEEVESLMIGTDGVEDLQEAAEKFVPGKDERVGPIDQFWTDDRYFQNPVAIDRKLHRLNSEVKRLNRGTGVLETFQGLLPDDTTMVVMRRKDQ